MTIKLNTSLFYRKLLHLARMACLARKEANFRAPHCLSHRSLWSLLRPASTMTHRVSVSKDVSVKLATVPVISWPPFSTLSSLPSFRVHGRLFKTFHDRSCASTVLCHARRGVHERAYIELSEDVSKGEAYETARDALLQLNLMIQRGIEPDALMYTSLIAVMARASLEWQAYKLFSRMIEMNVRPLPETYIALRDATSSKRVGLRAQIDARIAESLELLPGQLAEDELARRRTEDHMCVAKFNDYLRGELPRPMSAFTEDSKPSALSTIDISNSDVNGASCRSAVHDTNDKSDNAISSTSDPHSAQAETKEKHTSSSYNITKTVPTMHIRHPQDAWSIATYAQDVRQSNSHNRTHAHAFRAGDLATQAELSKALQILHEEELRIYLAVHRQLRHGTREQLIARVLRTVDHTAVRDMLARRQRYFRAVELLLEHDMHTLQSDQAESSNDRREPNRNSIKSANSSSEPLDDGIESRSNLAKSQSNRSEQASSPSGSVSGTTMPVCNDSPGVHEEDITAPYFRVAAADTVVTAHEKQGTLPEVMHTPWGILRKPRSRTSVGASASASPSSAVLLDRTARIRLSSDELALVCRRAMTGELDELPESLLRRYAYQYQLRWRRRQPLSLLEAVEWHAQTLLQHPSSSSAPVHTQQRERQQQEAMDEDDMQRSDRWSNNKQVKSIDASHNRDTTRTCEGDIYTRALRLQRQQREDVGARQTLANYEAFRIIAQRTNNLQVVDHVEINLHLRRVRSDAARRERQMTQLQRRESNVLAAAELAASARRFSCPEESLPCAATDNDNEEPVSARAHLQSQAEHISLAESNSNEHAGDEKRSTDDVYDSQESKGEDDNELRTWPKESPSCQVNTKSCKGTSEDQQQQQDEELPPWALFAGEDEFHLDTGRFGRAEMGRYRELSDSTIAVLPSRAAQQSYRVDTRLLPGELRAVVQEASLDAQAREGAVEAEYANRRRHRRYRRWDDFLRRARAKKQERKESESKESGEEHAAMRPLPPRRRMAQVLRRGLDQQRVSPQLISKFTRDY